MTGETGADAPGDAADDAGVASRPACWEAAADAETFACSGSAPGSATVRAVTGGAATQAATAPLTRGASQAAATTVANGGRDDDREMHATDVG